MANLLNSALRSTPSHQSAGWVKDKFLACAALLGLVLCMYGMNWGVAETWQADQMVYRSVLVDDRPPFRPAHFLKPPFHTYLSFFVVRAPVFVVSEAIGLSDYQRRDAATPALPWWIYPQYIDALGNQITILQRQTTAGEPAPERP